MTDLPNMTATELREREKAYWAEVDAKRETRNEPDPLQPIVDKMLAILARHGFIDGRA